MISINILPAICEECSSHDAILIRAEQQIVGNPVCPWCCLERFKSKVQGYIKAVELLSGEYGRRSKDSDYD